MILQALRSGVEHRAPFVNVREYVGNWGFNPAFKGRKVLGAHPPSARTVYCQLQVATWYRA